MTQTIVRALRAARPGARRPRLSRRVTIALLVALAAISVGSVVAYGEIVGTANAGHLTGFGPVSDTTGFPTWYKDDTGRRLEPCLDPNNSLCGFVPGDVPDTTAPVSMPDNMPEEVFYMLAGNTMDLPGGGKAATTLSLEGAFQNGAPNPGDQITFGRVRFFFSGLKAGEKYTITHPYGKDSFVAEQDPGEAAGVGRIRFTEDTGVSPGQFGGAINSRIGPFLKWDATAPAAPTGYIGDPDVEHPVTGSPYSTNFVRIEGPGVGSATNPCPAGLSTLDCAQSNVFSLQGKLATTGGVDIERATYSRDATAGTTLDVFASSDVQPQSIEVKGDGFDPTRLRGDNGHYEAHIAVTGAAPASVTVTNVGDQPASVKTATVKDAVTGRATYDADARTLRIVGDSSDTVVPPTLTATGYGTLNANGVILVRKVNGAPSTVEITSSAGGSVTVPVTITGASFGPIPVAAFAGPNQEVLMGRTVTLDGSGSTGPIKGYSWTQTGGPAVTLSDSTAVKPTFTAPDVPADGSATLTFVLTVSGSGGPQSSTVTVKVLAGAAAPVASAGNDQTVNQNVAVALDASLSTGATSYAWKQTGGTAVALTGANTAKPTFTSPKKGGPLTFQVTATGAGGSTTDDVVVTVRNNVLTTTTVLYDRAKRDWRIDGTSNVFGPNVTVTVHDGDLTAPVIGTPVNVDATGNWSVRGTGPAPPTGNRISIESSGGGTLTNVAVTVK